jgi:hypothetical protein
MPPSTSASPRSGKQIRDERVAGLEVATAVFDKSFSEWKPAVEYSLSSIKLELTKLNSFVRDAKHQTASKAGVLQIESASERAPSGSNADGPNGHCSDNTYRIVGLGRCSPKFMTRSRV